MAKGGSALCLCSSPWGGKIEKVENKQLPFKNIFYLFIYRQRGREGEREGKKRQYLVASCMPRMGEAGPQPRHVPQLGIEPVTLWFTGQHSIH